MEAESHGFIPCDIYELIVTCLTPTMTGQNLVGIDIIWKKLKLNDKKNDKQHLVEIS